jgi:Flp pilus assembly protein TadG
MRSPLIARTRRLRCHDSAEHGVTMILVAVAMVAIIAMAALSIDVVTLYLAREEAQRSADAAALAAARILSVSGLTGDPSNASTNWSAICGSGGVATQAAQAAVQQNAVGSVAIAATSITVTYSGGNGSTITSNTDCSNLSATAFGVNPLVTVQIQQTALPTFFSRIWGNSGNSVSATATAEAFNSSGSGNNGNESTGTITPVQPRCVKPWAVPNLDPLPQIAGKYCNQGGGLCQPLVNLSDGSIKDPGISTGGTGATGIIGETFWLVPDCRLGGNCTLRTNPLQANYAAVNPNIQQPPNLLYVPAEVGTTTVTAVPSCATGNDFNQAIVGCDQPTNYSCGVQNAGTLDLTVNPDTPTADAASCMIHQTDTTNLTGSSGQDYLNTFGAPTAYPFQILAGSSGPLVNAGLAAGTQVTSSPSIVSLPIYDNTTATITSNQISNVTYVGFLQVFINAIDNHGNIMVTVLNVSGCGNGGSQPVGTAVAGTSPVPIRLITPP